MPPRGLKKTTTSSSSVSSTSKTVASTSKSTLPSSVSAASSSNPDVPISKLASTSSEVIRTTTRPIRTRSKPDWYTATFKSSRSTSKRSSKFKSTKPRCCTAKSSRFTMKPTSKSASVSSKPPPFTGVGVDETDDSKPICRPWIQTPKEPPPRSVVSLLQERELGLGHVHRFPEVVEKMKFFDYRRVKAHPFCNNSVITHTIFFLRPGKNALIGAWYLENIGFRTAVGLLHYDLSRVVPGRIGYVPSRNAITDACQLQVNPDSFVCVHTHDDFGPTGEVHVAIHGNQESNDLTIHKYSHPYHRSFLCVNSCIFTERFTIGCDGELLMYSEIGIEEIRSVRDNVHALAYNEIGNTLYMGSETGDFVLRDLRTSEDVFRFKLDRQILDDVLLLSDENYCIVSGVSGCLTKVDIRQQSVVTSYPRHNRRSKRIPVSVHEGHDLLSASGADDTTRIWCLKTGKFLESFKPPSTYPARSCFVPNSIAGNIHLIQDNYVHIYSIQR